MVAFSRSQDLNRPKPAGWRMPALPTGGGVGVGLAAAIATALLPLDTLERLVWSSGVAALVPAAQPPLGTTARLLLVAGAGLAAGAVAWAALFLLWGPGGFLVRGAGRTGVRRADAHPDAPPRRPMTAADLGTPLMEVVARTAPPVQPLPADLDQPLAAFDRNALPAVPREPVRAVAPLAPGERIETFPLAPPPPPSVAPVRRDPATPQSIESLLRRLEEGASRRPGRVSAA